MHDTIVELDMVGELEYDKTIECIGSSYDLIIQYMNGLKSSRDPSVSSSGDVFYFLGDGFIKASRKEGIISVKDISSDILSELEKRLGVLH